jgi:hypothetical protein
VAKNALSEPIFIPTITGSSLITVSRTVTLW